MEQMFIPNQEYKVFVRCITYNHSKYIEDALNGFAMQQTNFPFVCLVMDDCSTDGEPDVIKTWIERECDMTKTQYIELELSSVIIAPHKSNTNCSFAIYLLKRNLWKEPDLKRAMINPWCEQAMYEACCEGDDYWIDPLKLSKQIFYLECNPSKSLVFTDCHWLEQDVQVVHHDIFKSGFRKLYLDFKTYLLDGAYIAPPTWVYRTKSRKEMSRFIPLGATDSSFCSSLNLFVLDQIGYLPETTAVYRELKESVSHSTDDKKLLKYKKGVFNTKCAFVEKYSNLFNEKEIEGLYSAFYLEIYRLAIICGDKELIQIIKAYKPLRNNWGLQLRIYMPWIVKLKNKLVKK